MKKRLYLYKPVYMQLLNVHSHQSGGKDELAIQNVYRHFDKIKAGSYYSVGLHPWFITSNWPAELALLEAAATQTNILAIGETGLDKNCSTNFSLQEEVFVKQIQLANRLQKPLIIHCVKAFSELQNLLRVHNEKSPVIFHGFNKSYEVARSLINNGYYLSFGKALQKPSLQQVLQQLPLSQVFFETDDSTISVQQIYALAAAALSIEENSLFLQVQKNAQQVFGDALKDLYE
jgi:TatD DNase family protein